MKCWGCNRYGQLGNGLTAPSSTPGTVGLGGNAIALGLGYENTCAVISTGNVKCWGYNEYGQLGDNSTINRSIPVDVKSLGGIVSELGSGANGHTTCAIMNSGDLKCWGWNGSGQVDDGSKVNQFTPVSIDVGI